MLMLSDIGGYVGDRPNHEYKSCTQSANSIGGGTTHHSQFSSMVSKSGAEAKTRLEY